MDENPFDTFGLDPTLDAASLTAALRERVEDAATPEEEARLREGWRLLTADPRRRLRLALRATGVPPKRSAPAEQAPTTAPPTLMDVLPVGDLRDALELPKAPRQRPLQTDPILTGEGPNA
ncbi:MAG: hypothetical protein AAF411_13900 [Myxococcota bacterium]